MHQGYTNLANAIILAAVDDYRKALREAERNPHNRSAKYTIREVERFFRSDHYSMMTKVEPELLIKKLREEANERKRVS